jgi:hypothetical protein
MAEAQPTQQPMPTLQQLMQMYNPKELMMLSQGLTGLMKVQAAMQPKPDPRQQAMQPGPMELLAMMELQRRQQEAMQQQMAQQPPSGVPVPQRA